MSKAKHSTASHSTTQHSPAQCSTAQPNTVQPSAMQNSTAYHSKAQPMQCGPVQQASLFQQLQLSADPTTQNTVQVWSMSRIAIELGAGMYVPCLRHFTLRKSTQMPHSAKGTFCILDSTRSELTAANLTPGVGDFLSSSMAANRMFSGLRSVWMSCKLCR